jgi:hypothetical protein
MDARAVNVALKACASKVIVDWQTGYLSVRWVHGGETSVMFAWREAED